MSRFSLRTVAAATGVVILALPFAVSAGTFEMVPTSFEDAPDNNVGNGSCATDLPGNPCTLRAAIMESNALTGLNSIKLNGGVYQLTIPGHNENGAATGDLDITDDLQIVSTPGVLTTIDGGGIDRVFDVQTSGDVLFSGIIIRNGQAADPAVGNQTYSGGGLQLRGSGSTTLQFCIVKDNVANTGGGIFSTAAGSTLIQYSVLTNNRTDSRVGITNPEGSALRANGAGTIRFENASIYGNSLIGSGSGTLGSISISAGALQMFSSTVDGDNRTGVHTYSSDVTLDNVTLSANGDRGLIWGNFAGTTVELFVRNSIIAGNGTDCFINAQSGATVNMDGHNIDSDGSCNLTVPGNGNQSGVQLDWMVGPLNTQIALPARFPWPIGPATDSGSPLDPTSGNPDACFRYDQRGIDRSTNGPCDVGAVESVLLFKNGFEGIII